MSWPVTGGRLALGDLPVELGGTIRGAELAWQAHGTLNAARDNVIVYPCSYGAQHEDLTWLIGPDGVLDPTRWFVVIPHSIAVPPTSPSPCAAWPSPR